MVMVEVPGEKDNDDGENDEHEDNPHQIHKYSIETNEGLNHLLK